MRLPEEPDIPPQLNIVPMIDVIFAILTFFIVSTLFLTRSEGLPVNLPQAATAEMQQNTPVTVTIAANGAIALNRNPVEFEALQPSIVALLTDQSNKLVVINADEAVPHGRVVAIMDQIRQIEGVQMGIATQRPAPESAPSEPNTDTTNEAETDAVE
ncbi:MAG: ExbD/TolR family protein [Thainema sp.]